MPKNFEGVIEIILGADQKRLSYERYRSSEAINVKESTISFYSNFVYLNLIIDRIIFMMLCRFKPLL